MNWLTVEGFRYSYETTRDINNVIEVAVTLEGNKHPHLVIEVDGNTESTRVVEEGREDTLPRDLFHAVNNANYDSEEWGLAILQAVEWAIATGE